MQFIGRTGIIFCLWGLSGMILAQQTVSDSLSRILESLPNDSNRLVACVEGARHRSEEVATTYLQLGKVLAAKTDNLHMLAKLYTEEAISSNISGQHVRGAELFLTVDSIYRVLNDTALIAGAQTNAGLSYFHGGQLDQALSHYFTAYELFTTQAPSQGYSRLLNNLAMCLKHAEKPDEARRYYLQSISIKERLGDSLGLAHTQHNLGLLYSDQELFENAIAAFDTALHVYQILNRTADVASTQVARGKAKMDAGRFTQAGPDIEYGYSYFHQHDPKSHSFQLAAGEFARWAAHFKKWTDADLYITQALTLAEAADRREELLSLYILRAEISRALGKHDEAYIALKDALTVKDSLSRTESLSLMEEMQTRFSVREKESELQLTALQLENQQRISGIFRTAFIASIAGILIIGLLTVSLFKSRKEIRKNQVVIENALKEKDALLREIHHRVKNNLQVISSLLAMQSFQSRDPNVSDAMREGQNRVHSMALIHQSLFQHAEGIEVDANTYVNRLVNSLKTAYKTGDRIAFNTSVDEMKLDVDTMIPLGLILNELVTNALKYAFPDQRSGSIFIQLKKDNGNIALQVTDNGIGMTPTRLDESNSLGYTLIRDFSQKLKATLQVDGTTGTKVSMLIPLKAKAS